MLKVIFELPKNKLETLEPLYIKCYIIFMSDSMKELFENSRCSS